MKKILAALLFAVLALAPFAGACDPSFPTGVHGALTINIPSCTADNYTLANPDEAHCDAVRTAFVTYLNSKSAANTSFTYVTDKNAANFIVYVIGHEVSTDVYTLNLKTYGMGKTSDGHTLFTNVGKQGEAGYSFLDAVDKFLDFLQNGWVCN